MIKAGCLCGGVQVELGGGDVRPVVNCHCSQCLKTHGNFAAYTRVKERDFHYVKQETLRWYRSSDFAQRGFCNRCGASLFWSRDNSDVIAVAAGVLEQPSGLKTSANIFVDSKGDYYDISDGLPQYPEGDSS